MMSVASLLNPIHDEHHQLPSPCTTRYASECSSLPSPPLKKQKTSKDAPVFARGKVQGQVRYPPWESYDDRTVEEVKSFNIYPLGRIANYHRHIPYNSDKKPFLHKTGRESFEVFQYTFEVPSEDRQYTVMWDYNIGLVRITPFFKCCQYAKTMPAKMLNANPGLREICHSITGGALAAQGYWMPFEAAKAVAATFCYRIRYALAPLFGPDFAALCRKPNATGFGQMIIDPLIIQQCTEEAREYRSICRKGSEPEGPAIPHFSSCSTKWSPPKTLCPRAPEPLGPGSGHCADGRTGSPQFLASPQSIFTWTAVNTPRSLPSAQHLRPPSPRETLEDASLIGGFSAPPNSPGSSSSSQLHPETRKRPLSSDDGDGEGGMEKGAKKMKEGASNRADVEDAMPGTGAKHSTNDQRAAYMLMQLHFADTSLRDGRSRGSGAVPTKRRRVSS